MIARFNREVLAGSERCYTCRASKAIYFYLDRELQQRGHPFAGSS